MEYKKGFFRPEDFYGRFEGEMAKNVAGFCNVLLAERGVRVYGFGGDDHLGAWTHGEFGNDCGETHSALLIDIQPIRKDSAESLLREFLDQRGTRVGITHDWFERAQRLLDSAPQKREE